MGLHIRYDFVERLLMRLLVEKKIGGTLLLGLIEKNESGEKIVGTLLMGLTEKNEVV